MPRKNSTSPNCVSMGAGTGASQTIEDPCTCNWNDCACCRKRLTEADHELGGDCMRSGYSYTCNFQNFFQCCCLNLHVPRVETDRLEAACQASQQRTSNDSVVRVSIAKHHFVPEMVRMVKAERMRWVTPLTPAQVEKWQCLPGGYTTDGMLRYDPDLGNGRPERWRKNNPVMHVKAPNAAEKAVKSVVESLDESARAAVLEQRRKQHQQRQDQSRMPEEWREMVELLTETASSQRKEIQKSKNEKAGLKRMTDDLKGETKRLGKQAKRAKTAAKETKAALETPSCDEIVWDQVEKLIASEGGLSRLTMFNDEWHDKHRNAARLLFGYDSWAETKQHIKDYFPEVNTKMTPLPLSPKTKGGDIKLPDLSDFEQCLI